MDKGASNMQKYEERRNHFGEEKCHQIISRCCHRRDQKRGDPLAAGAAVRRRFEKPNQQTRRRKNFRSQIKKHSLRD